MKVIIGIDDTDNLESMGTGHLVRDLSCYLNENRIFSTKIIIRHQLYVHKDIPYTSHNSSASLSGTLLTDFEKLVLACEEFLISNSATGSDVGLCILTEDCEFDNTIIEWGLNAKRIILMEADAYQLADVSNIYLKGLTGRKTGIIGALAAVGLALWGNDGRVLWMNNLREVNGVHSVSEIKDKIGIEVFKTIDNKLLDDSDSVLLGDWSRPVLRDSKSVLYVEQIENKPNEYKTATKHFIKSISE